MGSGGLILKLQGNDFTGQAQHPGKGRLEAGLNGSQKRGMLFAAMRWGG
jgi:hypothetical protein